MIKLGVWAAAVLGLVVAASASAQTAAPPPASAPPAAAPPDRAAAPGGLTDSQIGDQVDARIARLKADLRLTPDQERDWPALRSTLHGFGVDQMKHRLAMRFDREDRRAARRQQPRRAGDAGDAQPNAVDGMRREADDLSARVDALRKIADAADPIYKTMDDPQRGVFVRYLHEILGRRPIDL